MLPVRYKSRIVGYAVPGGGVLIGGMMNRRDHDPDRRVVMAMIRFGAATLSGESDEGYSHDRAELYARAVLMSDAAFDARQIEGDDALAAIFNVPVDQVRLKRDDLVTGRTPPRVIAITRDPATTMWISDN